MVRTMPWKLALLVVGAVAGFSTLTNHTIADDSEGFVRISNQAQPGQGAPAPIADNGGYSGGYVEGNCQTCQQGGTCGYHGCNMRPMGYVNHILGWANPFSGVGSYSPDHGYAPPGKVRTPHPQQVAYNKAFPDAWTGQPGAGGGQRAYHIYMPTDTTQLGYYYQAVPRWHANPAMIPPTPVPSQWHRDLCQGCQNGRCQLGSGLCNHCRRGRGYNCPPQFANGEQIISEQVIDGQSQPSANPTPATESVPAPINQEPAPPSVPTPIQQTPPAAGSGIPVGPAGTPLEKVGYPNLQPIR